MEHEIIDYIEVSVFDGHVESTGLLTHYCLELGRLHLLTDALQTNELFNLEFYSITRILISKSSTTYDTEEQYIFKNADDDQKMAKAVLINQLKILEIDERTSTSGFLKKGTFTNIPDKYKKELESISATHIVRKQRAASLGGATNTSGTTTTGTKTVYPNGYNYNYAQRNKKTITFVPRKSPLPSKAVLKKMKAMVKEVSADTYKQSFPKIEGDEAVQPPSQADIDDALVEVYGHGGIQDGHYMGAYD